MEILLMVDIQEEYLDQCSNILEYLNSHEGKKYLSSFDKVINIYNSSELAPTNNYTRNGIYLGEDYEYYVNFDDYEEINEYWYGNYIDYSISKDFGFFRDLMDELYTSEDIIKLGTFMYKNNINDIRDIINDINNLNISFDLKKLLNQVINLCLFLPFDLIEDILKLVNIHDKIYLIGGGEYECLEEIRILLKILKFKYIYKNNNLIY